MRWINAGRELGPRSERQAIPSPDTWRVPAGVDAWTTTEIEGERG